MAERKPAPKKKIDLFSDDATQKTSILDLRLFRELKLQPFETKLRVQHYVGAVVFGDSFVKIWVNCWPAMFWRFEVYCAEIACTYRVTTGSGSLVDYWETVKGLAERMITVEAIECEIKRVENEIK